jgi:hypothetical protein
MTPADACEVFELCGGKVGIGGEDDKGSGGVEVRGVGIHWGT